MMHRKGIGPLRRLIAVDDTCVAAEGCMKGVAVRRISETERFPTNIETAREHQHTVDVKGVGTVK